MKAFYTDPDFNGLISLQGIQISFFPIFSFQRSFSNNFRVFTHVVEPR